MCDKFRGPYIHADSFAIVTWDSPPRQTEASYSLFQRAFDRFVKSREVIVPVRSKEELEIAQLRGSKPLPRELKFTDDAQPQNDQAGGLNLMPFQVTGVNWLCSNWWKLQPCILADEMGLVSASRKSTR